MTEILPSLVSPPHFLIAPDSFKGSLSAVTFCEIAQSVILQRFPEAQVWLRPLSDGGEGFVESVVYAGLAKPQTVSTLDPLHRPIQARFAWQAQERTAFIEMAQASGLPLLTSTERNPLKTSSYGTGEVIQKAIQMGAKKIIIGLGGSATNDGGVGALQALGVPFYNHTGEKIDFRQTGAEGLLRLHKVGSVPEHLKSIEWVLAADVTNPLLGEKGATAVFAPQKGATEAMQSILEAGLGILAEKIAQKFQIQVANRPGSGAAGGFSAGFMGILQASLHPGFDLLSQALQLPQLIQHYPIQLVVTGEGRIDEQTLMGKLPFRLAKLVKTQSSQPPVCIGVCGQLEVGALPYFDALYCIHPIEKRETDWKTLVSLTPERLEQTLQKCFSVNGEINKASTSV